VRHGTQDTLEHCSLNIVGPKSLSQTTSMKHGYSDLV